MLRNFYPSGSIIIKEGEKNMDGLRIVALGGFHSVTSNMYLYHYLPAGREENSQILIVDCGVGFPEDNALGVDLVIPDVAYLKERQDKIVGMILTHGHEDHIGATPFILPQLSVKFPIWASRLTTALIKDKLEERSMDYPLSTFDGRQKVRLGVFEIDPVRVTHSIPDAHHFLIKTPVGNFYHGSDFKVDLTPPDNVLSDLNKIASFKQAGVSVLLSDCLGADKDGYSKSESCLNQAFEDEIRQARGRVFITAISSNLYRWQNAIEISRKFGRRVCLLGFSIKKMIRIAKELEYLKINPKDLIDPKRVTGLPDNQITFLVARSLGQPGSNLEKVVLGKHRISIKKGDKVIFSSPDYIPGTSKAIYRLIDNLIQQQADVIYGSDEGTFHVSGHGHQKELALLINLLSPQKLLPIGGEYRHAHQYRLLAKQMGFKSDDVLIPDLGGVPTFWADGRVDLDFKFSPRKILVDGLGIGDVGKVVLRDRRILSQDGIVVAILLVDNQQKILTEDPEIVSRGFVYVKENKELLVRTQQEIRKIFDEASSPVYDYDNVRFQTQGKLEEFLFAETGRQPMVIPVMFEV
ncbi:MAG: ribonuclease J [Patescibacteria group bacterium]